MPDVREALLDAAYDAAVTTGWQRARMADVAATAGVSRQTLYDQFGDRDGLAAALALRETERFLDGVERAMTRSDDIVKAVADAAAFSIKAARGNPLIRSILTEDGGLLPYMTTRSAALIEAATHRLVTIAAERWPGLDVREPAEVVVRLALSYIVQPAPRAAERIAAVAAQVLDRQKVSR